MKKRTLAQKWRRFAKSLTLGELDDLYFIMAAIRGPDRRTINTDEQLRLSNLKLKYTVPIRALLFPVKRLSFTEPAVDEIDLAAFENELTGRLERMGPDQHYLSHLLLAYLSLRERGWKGGDFVK